MKTQLPVCDICERPARFRFASTSATPVLRCWLHAVSYGPVVWRALRVALVVGTILFIINQLDVVLSGQVTPVVVLRIVLTYVTPFLVSMYSSLESNRLRPARSAPSASPPEMPGAQA
ncbi:MAG TPA: nitrate/nitrite transporter NrtS [Ktedonobacterales bacterium]